MQIVYFDEKWSTRKFNVEAKACPEKNKEIKERSNLQ